MANIRHRLLQIANGIHGAVAWSVANAAARAALSLVSTDQFRVAYQQDTTTAWLLATHSPATWLQMTCDAKANTIIDVVSNTTASYTLQTTDFPAGSTRVLLCNASSQVITAPSNSTAAIAIGKSIGLVRYGSNTLAVAAGGGASVRSSGSLLAAASQYAAMTLLKIGTDEWLLTGERA